MSFEGPKHNASATRGRIPLEPESGGLRWDFELIQMWPR